MHGCPPSQPPPAKSMRVFNGILYILSTIIVQSTDSWIFFSRIFLELYLAVQ